MNKKTFTAALIAALAVTGCARREEEPETPAATVPATISEAEAEKLVPKATIAPVNVTSR